MAARHHMALNTAVLCRNLALFYKKQSKKWFWNLGAPIIPYTRTICGCIKKSFGYLTRRLTSYHSSPLSSSARWISFNWRFWGGVGHSAQASLIWVVGRHFDAIWLAVATRPSPTTHSATTEHCRRSYLCTCDREENRRDREDDACRGYMEWSWGLSLAEKMQSGAEKKVSDCSPKNQTARMDENNYILGDVKSIDSE
jgi:hypothetical protein